MRPSIRYFSSVASLAAASIFGFAASASASEVQLPDATHLSIPGYHVSILVPATTVAATTYKVQHGDTLSSIASAHAIHGGWEHLYGINAHSIPDPNVIYVGQNLKLQGPVEASAPPVTHTSYTAPVETTQTHPERSASVPTEHVSTSGDSSFQQCVIERESGGNSQVMNSSGHYGLYQFSEGTWEAYGGSAADFGHATAGEQNQVFANAMAQDGESNWSAYDGC